MGMAISDPTAIFSIHDDKDEEIRQVVMLCTARWRKKGITL